MTVVRSCSAGAVAAALFGIPLPRAEAAFGQDAPRLPDEKLYTTDQERYWAELRRQWLLAPDQINLNCGAVGCSPLPVLRQPSITYCLPRPIASRIIRGLGMKKTHESASFEMRCRRFCIANAMNWL